MNDTHEILSERELSSWLGISRPCLQRMRSNGSGPPYLQLSERRIGYRKADVERWLDTRTTNRVSGLYSAKQAAQNLAHTQRI